MNGATRRATETDGGLVLVTGPAGIGKTRLAHHLHDAAAAAGTATLWVIGGRPGAPAFWPWTQMLRALPATVLERHPHARRLLGAPPAADDDPVADLRARFTLFDDVQAALLDAAPLWIGVDDLHEADVASLLLVAHIAPALRASRVTLVATARTDLPPGRAGWEQVWPELLRAGEVTAVGPLDREQVATLLREATGAADPAAVERIHRRTGGNALFACELIRLAATSGGGVEALPDTLRAVVQARIAERSAGCRRVLSLAAVIGVRTPVELLRRVLAEPDDDVAALLDEARASGFLERPDPQRLAFVHEIVRDAVYGALPAAHREHWHRAVADALAESAIAADAAHHYRQAGAASRAEAAAWFVRAGEAALATFAYENAAAHFAAALDAGCADQGAVRVRLGSALLAAGDAAGARAAHLAAVGLARASGDAALLASAALGLGAGPAGFEVALFDREQIEALEDALVALGDGEPALRAAVQARLSVALTYNGVEERRVELATGAVALARAAGDAAALGAALSAYCDVIAGPEHTAERRELTGEVVEIAQRLRDTSLELVGRRQRLVACLELGDMVAASDEALAFGRIAAALRQPRYEWYPMLWRAAVALLGGRIDEAWSLHAAARRIGEAGGSVNAEMLIPTQVSFIHVDCGDAVALRDMLASVPLDESMGPWVPIALALANSAAGNLAEARVLLDSAGSRVAALPRDSEWIACLTQAAEAIGLVGGHPLARQVYDLLRPYADLFVVEGIGAVVRGSVQRHLGILAAAVGEPGAARAHFDAALEANRRIGGRLMVARTLADRGAALGDADATAAARALYAEIGVRGPVGAAPASASPTAPSLRRDGETWTLTYVGRAATVRDGRGVRDLALLLGRPGRPVPAVDLAISDGRTGSSAAADLHEPGDLGDVVDEHARAAYKQRLIDLEDEAEQADAAADLGRSARIAAERDALLAQLGQAYGLAGRARKAGSPVERARTTVTARLRASIKRIAAVHPELGRHLDASVRTGTLCSYEPESPVGWDITP